MCDPITTGLILNDGLNELEDAAQVTDPNTVIPEELEPAEVELGSESSEDRARIRRGRRNLQIPSTNTSTPSSGLNIPTGAA